MRGKRAAWGVGLLAVVALAGVVAVRTMPSAPLTHTIMIDAVAMAMDEHDGILVIAGNDGTRGRLSVLDARTGTIMRHVALSSSGIRCLLALDEPLGRAFVVMLSYYGRPGRLDVVDLRRGTLLRTLALGSPVRALAVDVRTSRVIAATVPGASPIPWTAGRIIVLDARTGTTLRTSLAPQRTNDVVVDERSGHAFVIAQPTDPNGVALGLGRVSMLDTTSGRVLRITAVSQEPARAIVDPQRGRVFVLSYSDQAPSAGRVTTLDARSGRLLRSVTVGALPGAMSVDETAGRIFVLNMGDWPGKASISVLDARSGALVRTMTLPDQPLFMALDARRGHLFIAGQHRDSRGNYVGAGSVSMLDARSGRLLRSDAVETNPSALALDARRGRLFVVTQGPLAPQSSDFPIPTQIGHVSMLDTRSGRLLRTVPTGILPSAVAVDERTGRAFILDTGGTIVQGTRAPGIWTWLPGWLRRRLPFLAPHPQTITMPGGVTVLDMPR